MSKPNDSSKLSRTSGDITWLSAWPNPAVAAVCNNWSGSILPVVIACVIALLKVADPTVPKAGATADTAAPVPAVKATTIAILT